MTLCYFLIAFLASLAGGICGIGGGVIIKPVLDLFKAGSAAQISFLSSCAVLAMSAFSVLTAKKGSSQTIEMKTMTPLAIGAAAGGLFGSRLFTLLKNAAASPDKVSVIQAAMLLALTLLCFVYTLNKKKIQTHHLVSPAPCILIGLALGIISSFLGIGGGPLNLIALSYFLSMPAKTAAINSLYIILFSQITNIGSLILFQNVPAFSWLTVLLMILGGIGGGLFGKSISRRLEHEHVDKLFLCLMVVIMGICCWNIVQYS